jgi:hypothetical protein
MAVLVVAVVGPEVITAVLVAAVVVGIHSSVAL